MESVDPGFSELLAMVRTGDGDAARRLLELYEPQVRRVIRARLTDRSLRRVADSLDICQSVFAQFFVRTALGEFDLDAPEDLVRLLSRMARNRVLKLVEHQHAARRDARKVDPRGLEEFALGAAEETPSALVANAELLDRARALLTDEERSLAEQRALGKAWNELAEERGVEPDALRMRWKRSVERVSRQLGLGDGDAA